MPNDRRAERGVDRFIKAQRLWQDVALIVVQAHKHIGGAAFGGGMRCRAGWALRHRSVRAPVRWPG